MPTCRAANGLWKHSRRYSPHLVFTAVFAFWLLIGFLPTWNLVPRINLTTAGDAGLFGDSFGWINSLFTALAFAGVLLTLCMQREELQLQRREMKLTRRELRITRNEHARSAEAQDKSANQLFLAAYMNALESLRQYSQWRMSKDPARFGNATYPIVEGLVVQARVSQSLQTLIRGLDANVIALQPKMARVTEEGSNVWFLEQLLNVYLNTRQLPGTHGSRLREDDVFREAVNIVDVQVARLEELKAYCSPDRVSRINRMIAGAPVVHPGMIASDVLENERAESRKRYFADISKFDDDILHELMSICFE